MCKEKVIPGPGAAPAQAPTRVLMTADTVGGVWTYALELCAALGPAAEVTLATMGAPLSREQRARARRMGLDVRDSAWRLEWMDDPWQDVSAAGEWLLGLADDVRPDVVHLNGFAHGALPWRCPVVVVAHSCVYTWWEGVHGCAPPAEWQRYRDMATAGLRAANVVVGPTAHLVADIDRIYGPLPELRVIPNGQDVNAFHARPKEPFVFAAARLWDPAKNVAALIEAAPDVRWPVIVAGESTSPDGRAVALPPTIGVLGLLSRAAVAERMSRAAIFALPARYEPFGLAALEAALCGCTLVLGDIPSLREVWGDTALYVPPDDPPILAAALNRLAAADGVRRRLAVKAQKRARDFSRERMAQAYATLYRELVARAAGVAAEEAPAAALGATVMGAAALAATVAGATVSGARAVGTSAARTAVN